MVAEVSARILVPGQEMGKKDFYSFLHLTIAAGENPSLCKQSFCYFLLVKILEEEKISKKNLMCAVRESNPGRKNGNLA